jgi:DNA-binding PadR family transcriptional regulator
MSVRHALLGLLAQHPRHGYELHSRFLAVVGGEQNWDLKPAQVYTTLARLEEAGMVTVESTEQDAGPEKRIYVLTPVGEAELTQWLHEPLQAEPSRETFFLKLMIAIGGEVVDPIEVIHTQRAALYQRLHQVTLLRSQIDPAQSLAQVLLYDQSVMHLEADLRWLDMMETRLDDIIKQPLPEPEMRKRGRPRKGEDNL